MFAVGGITRCVQAIDGSYPLEGLGYFGGWLLGGVFSCLTSASMQENISKCTPKLVKSDVRKINVQKIVLGDFKGPGKAGLARFFSGLWQEYRAWK